MISIDGQFRKTRSWTEHSFYIPERKQLSDSHPDFIKQFLAVLLGSQDNFPLIG